MKIFISYSHKDEQFKDELLVVLAGMKRRGIITIWQDRVIEPGEAWRDEIKKAIKACNMGLLLISHDFMASDFIYYDELIELLNRRRNEGLLVVPIIVRHCQWKDVLGLGEIQALPRNLKPVITFPTDTGERDQIWLTIAEYIEQEAETHILPKLDKNQIIKPTSVMEGTSAQSVVALMQDKLVRLERAWVLATDAAVKFRLATEISELREAIAERSNNSPKIAAPLPDASWVGQAVLEKEIREAYLDLIIQANKKIGIPLLEKSEILLDDIYVELRGRLSDTFSPSINYETLPEAVKELTDTPKFEPKGDAGLRQLLHRNQWTFPEQPIDVVERGCPKLFQKITDKTVTLGEAFRSERRLVILGDPGSGKTTLLKWLAVTLSFYFDKEGDRVLVPSSKINPDSDDEAQKDDLGLKRIPILIRVASFNEWRKLKSDSNKSLADYIGYHIAQSAEDDEVKSSLGKAINLDVLHDWLSNLIEQDKTVLLVDGLDEINEVAERTEIAGVIDHYLDTRYLNRTTPKLSWSEATRKDLPVDAGGNQVVITSRKVGYDATQLKTLATHLTIEPMSDKAIERFCQKYVLEARRTAVTPLEWENTTSLQANAHQDAKQFIENIIQLRDKEVYDLTSNPIQLSILAGLFLKNNAQLPQQRTELYQAAIKEFLKHWDERIGKDTSGLKNHEETLKVLSQIAAQMLDKSSLGYIGDTELKTALSDGGIDTRQINGMLKLASEGVGLLSQRAPSVFSFLHLTFQEYLAGSWLLSQDPPAEAILRHIDSARWREALLMALGQQALLSAKATDDKLEKLARHLLAARHTVRGVTPLLLIASALREMTRVPDAVIDDLAMGIVSAYYDASKNKRLSLQLTQLESAFCQLCDACRPVAESDEKLQSVVLSLLESGQYKNREHALACVRLVTIARYYSEEIAIVIEQLLPFDDEALAWPVDRALSDIASSELRFLPSPEGSLQYELTANREWQAVVEQSPAWRGLCLLLYGGLDACVAEKFEANDKALNEVKCRQEENTSKPDSTTAKEQLSQSLDERRASLEAEQTALLASRNQFSASRLHRDSPVITPYVITALNQGLAAETLVQPLLTAYQEQPLTLSQRAEIVVALFALDQPVSAYLQADIKLQAEVLGIFRRVNDALTNAIPAAAKASTKALEQLANQLPETVWLEVMTEIIDINQLYGGKLINVVDFLKFSSDVSRVRIMAEMWQYFLSTPNDDRLYNMAVVLDTLGGALAKNSLALAQAFCAAYSAATQYGQDHSVWVNDKLARKPRTDQHYYRMTLEAIIAIPQPLQFVRGWAIAMLAPEFLKDNMINIYAIWMARYFVPDQFNARADALHALGVLNDKGLSNVVVNKAVKRSAWLAIEGRDVKKISNWKQVINELNSLPLNISKNPLNHPDFETLDYIFAIENSINFSDAPAVTPGKILSLIRALPETNDHENSALVLARLAFYLPLSVASAMVCAAIKLVALLQDPIIKVRLLSDVATIAQCFPEARILHEQEVTGFNLEIHKHKAAGFMGVYLKHEQLHLNRWVVNAQGVAEQQGDFTPLMLGSRIYNLKRDLGYVESIEAYWLGLAKQCVGVTSRTSTHGDDYIIKINRLAKIKSVRLTRQAALSMEILREYSAEGFFTAIKLVESPSPETLPVLIRWHELVDEAVRPYCSLLLAELGTIKSSIITDLIALLAVVPEDRLRYRIAVIFYAVNLRKEPKLRVSQLGAATLETLAIKLKTEKESDIRQALSWTFEHITHDDGEAIHTWAQRLDNNGVQAAATENIILSRIDEIDVLYLDAWAAMLACMRRGSISTRQALARSLCVMLAKGRVSGYRWEDVVLLVQETGGQCLGTMPVIEELCRELALSLNKAVTRGTKPTEFSAAFLKDKAKPLSAWGDKTPDLLKSSLTRIGDNCLAGTRFTERVADAAKLTNNQETIKYMLDAILLPEIFESTPHDGLFYFGSELLSLLAATIETHTKIFYKVLDDKRNHRLRFELTKQLPKIAQKHNTFTGRQAAFVVLSYLRTVTPDVCKALQSAMQDVPQVQQIALASVERYREIDQAAITQLKPFLTDTSTATAYMTGRLMFCLARNKYLDTSLHDLIISLLRVAAEHPDNDREVSLFEGLDSWDFQIRNIGMLDQLLLAMVDELTGTAHFYDTNRKRYN